MRSYAPPKRLATAAMKLTVYRKGTEEDFPGGSPGGGGGGGGGGERD